jgi:hypothetical protein
MSSIDKNLPLRSTSAGEQIETRPMYVEEWLDSLPYTDFKVTSQLLYNAIKATNGQQLKPSIRLELVELYNRPYQYYIDSHIKAGAQHTLQSIDTVQAQIKILKKIAVNLSLACKISAEESLKKKTLWGQTKPPIKNFFLALNYLSHALIFSYLEYAPTPKNVWKEINFIFDFAESLALENSTIELPDSYSMHDITTISKAYKRIILASLSDPYHLPYGAIWEIYEQLSTWVDQVMISKFTTPIEKSCKFVIRLDSDAPPLPIIKFNTNRASDNHRIIDSTSLSNDIQILLKTLKNRGRLDKSIILSPYFSNMILEHLSSAWNSPAKRKNTRKEKKGSLELACGLNPVFYFLNDMQPFIVPTIGQSDDEVIDENDINALPQREEYKVEKWELVDQSSRGFAVINKVKPTYNVKVSDLIIINTKSENQKWVIGVIRWLMINQGITYKIGVQILSVDIETAAIKATSGSNQDTRYRRALLLKQSSEQNISVITSKGIFMDNREVEIIKSNKKYKTRTIELLESTIGFEQFNISDSL